MTTANTNEDKLILGGHEFTSRFILWDPENFHLELVKACIEKAGAQIVTLALRRANEGGLANILDYVPKDVTLLPNTSGARNAAGSSPYRKTFPRAGLWRFCKARSYPRLQIPSSG